MSHTYRNLKKKGSPTRGSRDCASRVPLVHTVYGKPAGLAHGRLISILKSGCLRSPCIDSDRQGKTAANEAATELSGSPIYLYAGRVHPDPGASAALLLGGWFDRGLPANETLEYGRKGRAFPFDSGGLIEHTCLNKDFIAYSGGIPKYCQDHAMTDLSAWRGYFSLFLTTYFSAPRDYWEKGPKKCIDRTDFRKVVDAEKVARKHLDWTFEIQFLEKEVPISRNREIYITKNCSDRLTEEAEVDPDIGYFRAQMIKIEGVLFHERVEARAIELSIS